MLGRNRFEARNVALIRVRSIVWFDKHADDEDEGGTTLWTDVTARL